jgi:hypothetical protein
MRAIPFAWRHAWGQGPLEKNLPKDFRRLEPWGPFSRTANLSARWAWRLSPAIGIANFSPDWNGDFHPRVPCRLSAKNIQLFKAQFAFLLPALAVKIKA